MREIKYLCWLIKKLYNSAKLIDKIFIISFLLFVTGIVIFIGGCVLYQAINELF